MCLGPNSMADNTRQSGKVFVGGLSWDTTGEKLRAYFENWGVVREAFVSYNRANGRPRGFGFVVFQDAEVADKVVATKHTIDRREVEAKKAVPKEEQPDQGPGSAVGGSSAGVNDGSAAAGLAAKSRKIFVGGLAPAVDEAALRAHFEAFGPVEDAVVMYDHDNKRPRGFGFVTFAAEESVDLVFAKGAMQTIADKQIEVKSAVPRDLMPPTARPGQGYPGFDPRFAHSAGPRGLYGNPYLAAQGLHNQFAGLPLGGPPGRGYGGGPHRGIVPSAAGPQQHRAPGRYDPTAAGLGQMGGFPQQQSAAMAHGMHSQGLGAAGGKVPPMGMQAGGGYGLYGAGASLSNGAGATGAMFGPGSSAALAYNIASLQQAQAHLNGMAAAGVPPAVQQGAGHAQVPAGGQGKLGGAAFGASTAASSLTSLKALAMASGLGGAFPGQAGAPGAPGSGPGGDDGSGTSGFAVQQQQQPSEKDFADAAAAVNAAAAGLVQVATDYSSYHDPSSFSTAPAPGWSS